MADLKSLDGWDGGQHPVRVFVYGTLKPGCCYYPHYCADRVLEEQPAQVRGQLFHLSLGYPAITEGDQWVKGYLLSFRDASELAVLDELEDYDPQRPTAKNLYDRTWVDVFDRESQPLGSAWIYRMAAATVTRLGGIWIPSGEWRP
ncbi:gamma-glutamylcyclotransferase [Synechococcales cyanobacterium C]|uniref:Gamma-glutamylcyclotransferase n=1 Tax=Petrachloros mirabilis ULC683 TaxID=2781853 RepID=A0A8K1ZZ25_9CYAN|nr:gamma-glutamylcyclotransferase [Petrachloros mirabilis]NCJ07799.1 gamma-glutamylcyclotransferase [Petrachloros mirabilis ULC683]